MSRDVTLKSYSGFHRDKMEAPERRIVQLTKCCLTDCVKKNSCSLRVVFNERPRDKESHLLIKVNVRQITVILSEQIKITIFVIDDTKCCSNNYSVTRREDETSIALIFAILLHCMAGYPTNGYARSETLIARCQTRRYSMEEI